MKRCLYITLYLLAVTFPTHADWMDDWVAQKTVAGGSSFENQKRGFYSGGSVSLRYKRSSDYLVSVAKPRFQRGCGGIDVFLGGIGFMKYKYLVEKLQRLMGPAAAAFAFDIAMNTLCEPCSKSMKSMEAIIDRLNALQLDDCKAQQAIVATLKDTTGLGGPANTAAVSEFLQSTGASDLFQEIKAMGDGNVADEPLNAKGFTKADLVSGCPAELIDIFFTPGSLLDNLARVKHLPTSYTDLMRGLLGDVLIGTGFEYNFVPPCDENSEDILNDVIYGNLYIRDSSNNCVPITSVVINSVSYPSFKDWTTTQLENIITNMITKSALSIDQIAFLKAVPGPIYIGIINEIMLQGQDIDPTATAEQFTDICVVTYASHMLNSLYYLMDQLFKAADTVDKNKKGSATGLNQAQCALDLKDEAINQLREIQKTSKETRAQLRQVKSEKVKDYTNYFALASKTMELIKSKQKITLANFTAGETAGP